MIPPSLDHLPFMMGGADVSVTFEQQIPLSGIRRSRRAAALAAIDRLRAEANRTALDVGMQAANAFLMLQERRRTQSLVAEQVGFARDVVNAANARYSSGTAPQSDVLRAEVEVARLDALARSLVSDVRGAERCSTRPLLSTPSGRYRRSPPSPSHSRRRPPDRLNSSIKASSDQESTLFAANTLASPPAAFTSVFSHSKSSRALGLSGKT